jgi:regulator of protease activity HflC (stomatin/prohibitin superfamily)
MGHGLKITAKMTTPSSHSHEVLMKDRSIASFPGLLMLVALLSIVGLSGLGLFTHPDMAIFWIPAGVVSLFCLKGLTLLQPGEAAAFLLFGKYVGTLKQDGFFWVNPFYNAETISLRLSNFESAKLKVNDSEGNPIEIGAVVSWRITEAAAALFAVEDVDEFVRIQSETAVRDLANHYPYEASGPKEISLRGKGEKVAELLKVHVQARLGKAGVEVHEARLSHLAYAPEIAQAMLQRQQASAIVAARQRIVEGAVGMVDMALKQLSKRKLATLSKERKAALVSNLLIVLCGERGTQPTIPLTSHQS